VKEKIYFAAGDGRLKVGTTSGEVSDRVTGISAHLAEPLKVIGSIDGGLPFERAIQKYMLPWRLKGEWFRDCDEVRAIVDRLLSEGPGAIGYDGSMFYHELAKTQRDDVDRPSDPGKIGRLLRLMWADRAIAELSAFAGCSQEQASRWLDGAERPPRLVRYALAAIYSDFLILERVPSFLQSGEDGSATYTPREDEP
jgi:hypothetical protein